MPLQIAARKPEVHWSGSFFAHHSLALVNRELTLALLKDTAFAAEFDLSLHEVAVRGFSPGDDPRLAPLIGCLDSEFTDPSVTVRHAWPPNFRPASTGKLILCQPWEFGSIPRDWVAEIGRTVDEVWAYTSSVRQAYIESGVPPEKVQVIPLGIDPSRFHPGVRPFDFTHHRQTRQVASTDYKFLFVGGTIPRKGIEVLLDAFDRSFCGLDPVTLIIKDFGADSFYANQGAGLLIRALQAKPGGAKLVYITDDLSERELAELYSGCDCVVQPYRGEGYGLPIAEAMACGKPTIVTGAGAAMDFANEENAYLIPATRQYLQQTQISGMELVSRPYWFEPDRDALRTLLRQVVDNRAEAKARGEQAARDMVVQHTWAHAASRATPRLAELAHGHRTAMFTSYSLPMGLANFGLSALNGVELPRELQLAHYEDRKQTGLSQARSSDWSIAAVSLEECLRERPDDWETLNALAITRFRMGDRESALGLLRRALAEAEDTRDLDHNLAFVLLASDGPEEIIEAVEHAERAYRRSPANPDIRRTLERGRHAALGAARRIMRSGSFADRGAARRDPTYRALMDCFRRATNAIADPLPSSDLPCSFGGEENPAKRTRISLVMIVKNEERFLPKCLTSAREVVDEIVIVDTGSTDATMAIALQFGAKVIPHTWSDDFSEARNIALAHATGDWALWLDADEEIEASSGPAFRAAAESAAPDVGGFMVRFRNWLQSTTVQEDSDMAVHHACRLFRLVPGVRFEGRIHEQNLRSLQNLGYRYEYTPGLTLDHFGYASEIMTTRNKHERFIRMLTREVEECPDPSLRQFHLFNLGNAYFTLGDMENAVIYLRLAAAQPDLKEEFTASLFTELATALQQLGRPQEGLDVCREAASIGLCQSGVEFARGYCLLHLLRYEGAEKAFRSALQFGASDAPLSQTGDRGTSSYKARYGLALALLGQDRYDEALPECAEALTYQPGFVDARYLEAVLLLRLKRREEAKQSLEAVLDRLPNHPEARKELARLIFELGEYGDARPHLEAAVRAEPDSIELNAQLADCYERCGATSAARAVYDRLRLLAPGSAEARVNLGRMLAIEGAHAEALESFTTAIRLDGAYGNAYFNAGDLLYRLGEFDRAAETYAAGLQVDPDQPSGFFVLGNSLFRTGRNAEAAVSYRQELIQNPDHLQAKNNLELVEDLMAVGRAA